MLVKSIVFNQLLIMQEANSIELKKELVKLNWKEPGPKQYLGKQKQLEHVHDKNGSSY